MSSHFDTPYAALMYDDLEEYEDVIAELTKHIQGNQQIGAALHNRAIAKWEIGRVEEALVDFDHAILALPTNQMPAQAKGMMLQKLGRIDEAVQALDHAVAIAPNVATVRRTRGHILVEAGRLQEALADLQHAVKLEPEFKYTVGERDKLLARIRAGEQK